LIINLKPQSLLVGSTTAIPKNVKDIFDLGDLGGVSMIIDILCPNVLEKVVSEQF